MGEYRKLPECFGSLMSSAHHAADRAWTGLLNFLTAQSVLALAWATMIAAPAESGKGAVMLVISFVGMLTGLAWSLLSTRMWQFHLEYVHQARRIWESFSVAAEGPGARAWLDVDEEIGKVWRRKGSWDFLRNKSGNQWILFTAPLLIAAVHLSMWVVAALNIVDWPTADKWPKPLFVGAGVVFFGLGVAVVWGICREVLHKEYPSMSDG